MQLHVVTPGTLSQQDIIHISSLIHPHVTAIHIREKSWTQQHIRQTVQQMLLRGIPASKIMVNNHPELVVELGIKGVHMPEFAPMPTYNNSSDRSDRVLSVGALSAGPNEPSSMIIGRSVHSAQRAVEAEQEGCHYAIFGHIYATNSKLGMEPRGIEELAQVCSALHIPVIAIGGIQPQHIAELRSAGVAGIAVMSSIFTAHSPLESVQQYVAAIQHIGTVQAELIQPPVSFDTHTSGGSDIHAK
ncbi:thiamine phosphate synthase [Paenibacillus kandeliae]|uniref:thiamine phosphate synthase n=1 Tax=Paenibacillus kandeliae TaxID=3231269 RepID=UPI0034592ED2